MEAELPDWMADDWTVRREAGAAALVRRDFVDAFDRLGLLEAASLPPEELAPGARPFRPEGGRGELGVLPAAGHGEVVIRPYRRGGLAARFAERTYLLGDRAFHEAEITERLRRAGVPVPEPVAAVQSDHGPGYRAALLTLRILGGVPAPERLGEAAESGGPGRSGGGEDRTGTPGGSENREPGPLRDALRRMGRSAGRMHAAGVVHADLNAHNFLLPGGGGEAVILDFDRARHVGRGAAEWLGRMNLRRLRRSLDKLELGAALERWDAFEEAYEETLAGDS